jgi:hypothetical protein
VIVTEVTCKVGPFTRRTLPTAAVAILSSPARSTETSARSAWRSAERSHPRAPDSQVQLIAASPERESAAPPLLKALGPPLRQHLRLSRSRILERRRRRSFPRSTDDSPRRTARDLPVAPRAPTEERNARSILWLLPRSPGRGRRVSGPGRRALGARRRSLLEPPPSTVCARDVPSQRCDRGLRTDGPCERASSHSTQHLALEYLPPAPGEPVASRVIGSSLCSIAGYPLPSAGFENRSVPGTRRTPTPPRSARLALQSLRERRRRRDGQA